MGLFWSGEIGLLSHAWKQVCAPTLVLAAVALALAHPATRYVDILGSVMVASYLLWSGVRMGRGQPWPLSERWKRFMSAGMGGGEE